MSTPALTPQQLRVKMEADNRAESQARENAAAIFGVPAVSDSFVTAEDEDREQGLGVEWFGHERHLGRRGDPDRRTEHDDGQARPLAA